MKRLRGLFRLGMLTLLALTLTVAMTLPASASSRQVCSSGRMLPEVEIVSVEAEPSSVQWRVQDLVKFSYPDGEDEDDYGDIENGLLKIVFKDIINTRGLDDFDGYIIEARPGDNDPGDSKKFGVPDYTSVLIPRPAVVGATVTRVLNLEPGTKYYVTVHAVNHNTVQISPDQRAQDSSSATTLLSAPFLGALVGDYIDDVGAVCLPDFTYLDCWFTWDSPGLFPWSTDAYEGTHFAFYDADGEAGQHYFRWLNPAHYGPYDHILIVGIDDDRRGQADMLSLDKDGVEDHCEGDDFDSGSCGHTHYRFEAVDGNGRTVASELVETGGIFDQEGGQYFQTVFTAEKGELTLFVSLGRVDDGRYRAMSDTASVTFDAPGDLRAFDQIVGEYHRMLDDITDSIEKNEDAKRWLGKNDSGTGRSLWNPYAAASYSRLVDHYFAEATKSLMTAYLNNQLK